MGMIKKWSFSRLKQYEECPHRVFLSQIEGHKEPGTEYTIRGNEIHQNIEDYIKGLADNLHEDILEDYHPIINEIKHAYETPVHFPHAEVPIPQNVFIEDMWAYDHDWNPVDKDDPSAWLRVILDAAVLYPNFTAKVVDWKSGKKSSNAMVSNTLQMQLYAISMFQRFPQLTKVTCQLQYVCVKTKKQVEKTYSRDQALNFRDRWTARADAMCNDTEFLPRPNIYNCRFCSFSDNNLGICRHSVEF